jgi:hypothetical protein
MKKPSRQRLISTAGLVVALTFLVVGNLRVHKVYEADSGRFGLLKFRTISEFDLVMDSTFGGVRGGDRLTSTYDRSAGRGKRACPT